MKVNTDLKAGSALTDAAQEADQVIDKVSSYLANAGQQAQDVSANVTEKASSLWNCLYSTFS